MQDIDTRTSCVGEDAKILACQIDHLIVEWIEAGLKKIVGRTPPPRAGWASQFLTRELIASEKIVDYHILEWDAHRDDADLLKQIRLRKTYEAHLRPHRELVARRKLAMYKDFCQKLDGMEPAEQSRTISAIRRNKARAKGSPLRTDSESMADHGSHFAKQFQNVLPEVAIPEVVAENLVPMDWNGLEHVVPSSHDPGGDQEACKGESDW